MIVQVDAEARKAKRTSVCLIAENEYEKRSLGQLIEIMKTYPSLFCNSFVSTMEGADHVLLVSDKNHSMF